ncbi:MAG TPA: hypothetical protein VMZ92_12150 [Planctomycetota bacterium]|nr:hypothetical protein [Planctomycetota bacterium]
MKKRKPARPRNPVAYALALRGRGRTMKDRRAPRGGVRNEHARLLAEYRAERD